MDYIYARKDDMELFSFELDSSTEESVGKLIYLDGAEIGYLTMVYPTPDSELGDYDVELLPTHEIYRARLYAIAKNELAYLIYTKSPECMIDEEEWETC